MSGRRRSDRALRPVLKRSPGRPGVAQRENRRRFWAGIATGVSSEEAASGAGVQTPAYGVIFTVRAGKIVRIAEYADPSRALEVQLAK